MITEIQDINIEILAGRIINGLEFCNTTWQRARVTDDPVECQRLFNLLDSSISRLHGLIHVASIYGLHKCVFRTFKFSDNFHCFGCTKSEAG